MASSGSRVSEEILVTYGPTRARVDDVRYLCNQSSGRLGALLVRELARNGFRVHAIQGPGAVAPRLAQSWKSRVEIASIETVQDLIRACDAYLAEKRPLAIVHAMAVLDYVPDAPVSGKIGSGKKVLCLRLKPTPKVIARLRRQAPGSHLISFKLESGLDKEALFREALASLKKAGSDWVVANDLSEIHGDRHLAFVLNKDGEVLKTTKTKQALAEALVDLLKEVRGCQRNRAS